VTTTASTPGRARRGEHLALSFVGAALGVRSVALDVDRFSQTGSQAELYPEYGIDAASIATAALVALEPVA
jgi:pyruvate dehydrogenase complex dehydrogenase (E1) component